MARRITNTWWQATGVAILGLAVGYLAPPPAAADTMEQLAAPKEGRSMRATSTARLKDKPDECDPNSNSDNRTIKPGQTHVLMDAKGPGAITHIWVTFLGPEPQNWAPKGAANHQEMLLRIFYDGDERPGVEAPVGDFFANCFGERRSVVSIPVIVEDADSYNCFWRMPFRKSCRVEITNQSEDKNIALLYYNIDWVKLDSLSEDTPYFYAQYKQEYPVEQGKDYVILETEGKGHYVGTVMAVRTRSPMWFGEGDEKVYIDEDTTKPSIWGTGTEDYFLSAWGLQTTSTPFFGTPYFDQWGVIGGHTSAYRWHVNDPFVFQKKIKVTIEHFGWISPDENAENKTDSWNERQDDYSSVAFWYQTGKPTFAARAPGGKERKLPSLERVKVYAAETEFNKNHGKGEIRTQPIGTYPKGHVFYRPESPESAYVEFPITVKEKEPLHLVLSMTRADDYGQYQATLNGVKIGGVMDFYNEKIDNWEYHLLDFWPEPGNYTLKLECVGKNRKSAGFGIGVESVQLRERRPRVKEWGWDKDKNWKEKPILYGD